MKPIEIISQHPVLKDIKLSFIISAIESVMKEYAYQEKAIMRGDKIFPLHKDKHGNIIDSEMQPESLIESFIGIIPALERSKLNYPYDINGTNENE